jgi:hypothetical protein
VTWNKTKAHSVLHGDHSAFRSFMYRQCHSCTLRDGSKCTVGAFVVVHHPRSANDGSTNQQESSRFIGRVIEMLQVPYSATASKNLPSHFLVQVFHILGTSATDRMPELLPANDQNQEPYYLLLSPEVVQICSLESSVN